MKRRGFLKAVVGVVGAAVAGLKVKPAVVSAPVSAFPPPFADYVAAPRGLPFLVNQDSIHVFMSASQHEAYKRLGYPSRLSQFINDGGSAAMMSCVSYPDLSAPTPDAHGSAISAADFERAKTAILNGKR